MEDVFLFWQRVEEMGRGNGKGGGRGRAIDLQSLQTTLMRSEPVARADD